MTETTRRRLNEIDGDQIAQAFDKIILHHTATPRESKFDVEWCRLLHKGFGWRDIGYHYYIDADAELHIGRPVRMRGAHTLGQNADSIGIAYCGGMKGGRQHFTMTYEQSQTVLDLIQRLRDVTGKELPLFGHRDFKPTFCPGFDVHDEKAWPRL